MYNIYQDGGDPTGSDFLNGLMDMGMSQQNDDAENPQEQQQFGEEPELSSDFINGLSDYAKENDNKDLQDQLDELKNQLNLRNQERSLYVTQQDLEDKINQANFYQTPQGEDALLAKYEPRNTSTINDNPFDRSPRYTPSPVTSGGGGVNNVGNLRDPVTGKFQNFATPEQGEQKLINQLHMYQTGTTKHFEQGTNKRINGTTTLLDAMKVYAPASDKNNPLVYAKFIAKKAGVTIDTKIGDINTQAWANAIKIMEGNTKTTKKQIGGYSAAYQGGRLTMVPAKDKHKYSC